MTLKEKIEWNEKRSKSSESQQGVAQVVVESSYIFA